MSNSVVDIGKLAKPIDTLVKKIASATGMLYAPTHARRMAKAEADAALTKAHSENAVSDLKRRTATRLMQEEMRKQENMEGITERAIPQLEDKADASKTDDDWMANFFEKCRNVSNEEMQQLWAKILAGEVNKPGSFSKRTISFLADIDKNDAESFAALCSFGFGPKREFPIIIDVGDDIYKRNGLSYAALIHLDSIGLINFGNISSFSASFVGNFIVMPYFGKSLVLNTPESKLDVGHVILTPMGKELAPLTAAKEVDGFLGYMKAHWSSMLDRAHHPEETPLPS
ncbi:MAG: DUF2806 domain-containing protein [Chthoniobacter sp.]|nr:DUF2806 domain-containing protein [Chthoniobacter sp.]